MGLNALFTNRSEGKRWIERSVKQWQGGVRVFAVEVFGSDASPKQIVFCGERVEVAL